MMGIRSATSTRYPARSRWKIRPGIRRPRARARSSGAGITSRAPGRRNAPRGLASSSPRRSFAMDGAGSTRDLRTIGERARYRLRPDAQVSCPVSRHALAGRRGSPRTYHLRVPQALHQNLAGDPRYRGSKKLYPNKSYRRETFGAKPAMSCPPLPCRSL